MESNQQSGVSEQAQVICYGRTAGRNFIQEWYETASRHAGKRARELRKLGYTICVSSMGSQVTSDGVVKMTLLTVINPTYDQVVNCPLPARIEVKQNGLWD